jgi:hypothetical protein
MASKIQFKRGTTTQSDAYRGAEGEVIINTTKDTIVVHDGVEAGGYEIIRSDLSNISGNVPAVNITDVDCGIYGSGLFTLGAFSSASLSQTIDNPNAYGTSTGDQFGQVVATSGNYAIVGASNEDEASGTRSGKAYIFNNSTGALLHTLDNPNAYGTKEYDSFGYSVAITDTYAIVGAVYEEDAGGLNAGKAYIYNNSTGALLHTLDNPNDYGTSVDDMFGNAVAISNTYAIVGAIHESFNGGGNSGKAYIFNVSTGALLHTLDNPTVIAGIDSAFFNFGNSVAISGNYAIVGAYGVNDAGGNASGKAYIYNNSTGALLHTLNNPNAYGTSTADRFGNSVAISGNYAIVSAPQEDDAGGNASGKAYIFNVSTGALVHTLNNPNAYDTSASDVFGHAVAISGNYAIVGAYGEDDSGGTSSGKAYIFNVSTGALLETIDNPNAYDTSATDIFGFSVAITDTYAIVGASREDDAGGTESGKAYIFELESEPGNEIEAPGAPTIGTAASVNASTVAVQFTAPAEDGYATIETYTATSSPGGITGTLSQAGSGTITVTGLTENTSYTFTVTATNSYTTGDPSSASNSVVPVPPPLDWSDFTTIATNTESSIPTNGGAVALGTNYYATGGEATGNKVSVYNNSNGGSRYTLSPSNADRFGKAMAMYEDLIVVGDSYGKNNYSDPFGRIHVYDLSQSSESNAFVFKQGNPVSNFGYGSSVTINSSLIATAGGGGIYLYNHSGVLQKTLTASELSVSSSGFGYIIRLTEDYLFISNNNGSIYQVDLSDYSLERTITSSEGGAFGRTINASEDGSMLIVSAPYLSTPIQAAGQTGGKVYVYNTSDGSLVRSFSQPNSSGYILGRGSAEGNTGGVAVTSTHAFMTTQLDVPAASKYTPVYAYRLSDGTLQNTFVDSTNNTTFGSCIAVLGNDLLVGATNGKRSILYRAEDT